jgi:DNA-directed RNA polymerase specialized sigma24 family protein
VYEIVGLFVLANCMKNEEWRTKMSVAIEKTKREGLIKEIISVLDQWPERERSIFSQAHYEGQSVDAISRSLQLNVEEVQQILRLCERRLHASLKNLQQVDCEAPSLPAVQTARPAA